MKTCLFYDQETEYCRSTLGATEVIAAALQRAFLKTAKNKSVRVVLLLFPNTSCVMKIDIVLYVPKPWNHNHQKWILTCVRYTPRSILGFRENLYFYDQETWYCREHVCINLRSHRSNRGNSTKSLNKKQQNKTISQFVSVIVSKPVLGHENVCCFILSQALELQPSKIEF